MPSSVPKRQPRRPLPLQSSAGFSFDAAGQLCAGYGAYALWLLIAPTRFGYKHIDDKEMLRKHHKVQQELRLMFPSKTLKIPKDRFKPTFYKRAIEVLEQVKELRPDISGDIL